MLTRMWRNWVIYAVLTGRHVKWYSHSGRGDGSSNRHLTPDPAIPLLGVYPRKIKTYIYTKTCTQMILVA